MPNCFYGWVNVLAYAFLPLFPLFLGSKHPYFVGLTLGIVAVVMVDAFILLFVIRKQKDCVE